jgi:hypothetical protein
MTANRLRVTLLVQVLLVVMSGVGRAQRTTTPNPLSTVGPGAPTDSVASALARYLSHRKLSTTRPVAVRVCSSISGPDVASRLQHHLEAMTAVAVEVTTECAQRPAAYAPDPQVPVVLVRSITFRSDTAVVAASVWYGASLRLDESATLVGPRWGVLYLTFYTPVHSDRVPRGP